MTKCQGSCISYEWECLHFSSKLFFKTPPRLSVCWTWLLVCNSWLYCSQIRPTLPDLNVNMRRSPKSYLRPLLLPLNRPAPPRCPSSTLKTWTSMTFPARTKNLSPRWVEGFLISHERRGGMEEGTCSHSLPFISRFCLALRRLRKRMIPMVLLLSVGRQAVSTML